MSKTTTKDRMGRRGIHQPHLINDKSDQRVYGTFQISAKLLIYRGIYTIQISARAHSHACNLTLGHGQGRL